MGSMEQYGAIMKSSSSYASPRAFCCARAARSFFSRSSASSSRQARKSLKKMQTLLKARTNDDDYDDDEEARKRHRKRNKRRSKEQARERVSQVLGEFFRNCDDSVRFIEFDDDDGMRWDRVPRAVDPATEIGTMKKTAATRGGFKRKQIECVYRLLVSSGILRRRSENGEFDEEKEERKVVVDFGCGSGNLTVALAYLFPKHDFVGVDLNARSIEMLNERIAKAGVKNVRAECNLIEKFDEEFDVALALHVCGNATDMVLSKVCEKQKDFVCVPCCVGKKQNGGHSSVLKMRGKLIDISVGDDSDREVEIVHPRSQLMRSVCDEKTFMDVAKLADWSGDSYTSAYDKETIFSKLPTKAKEAIEIDRAQRMIEKEYKGKISLLKLPANCGLRNDLILGVV
jgi:2-polyprenyl-3-methyl-5-hydroxy-6-metoxy-1,4-benzoquinol methylase